MPQPAEPDQQPASAPATLRWAVRVLFVQAAALAVFTLFVIFRIRGLTSPITGYVALITVLLVAIGVGLSRRRRWVRGPAIVAELFQMAIGYNMLFGHLPEVGAPMMVLGLAGAALLLAPGTRRALGMH